MSNPLFAKARAVSAISIPQDKYEGKQGESDLLTFASFEGLEDGVFNRTKTPEPSFWVFEQAFFRRPDGSVVGKVAWPDDSPDLARYRELAETHAEKARTYHVTYVIQWPGAWLKSVGKFEVNWQLATSSPADTVKVMPLVMSRRHFESFMSDHLKARVKGFCYDTVFSCTDGQFQAFDYYPQPELTTLDAVFKPRNTPEAEAKVQALRTYITRKVREIQGTFLDVVGDRVSVKRLEELLRDAPNKKGGGGDGGGGAGGGFFAPPSGGNSLDEALVGSASTPAHHAAHRSDPASMPVPPTPVGGDDDIPF